MVHAAGVRYARGEQRRAVLVEAAADLLLTQGLSGLTHRAVAQHAGLPLASTTYYFPTAQELGDAALRSIAQQWDARAAAALRALPDRLEVTQAARAVGVVLGTQLPRGQLLLAYERYLEVGRHQRLRDLVLSWNAVVRDHVREVLRRAGLRADDPTVALVLAAADGAALTALAEGTDPDRAVTVTVGLLLSGL